VRRRVAAPYARRGQIAGSQDEPAGSEARRDDPRAWPYVAYAWALFWLMAPLAWLGTVLSPRPALGWALSHGVARLFLRLAGTRFAVSGLENLPRHGAYILAANHASYLDGVVMVAALARPHVFIAKGELRRQFVPRWYLSHLGAYFVERIDPRKGPRDLAFIARLLRGGVPVIFFPEGSFRAAPGLLPFHMGAFLAATRAGVPVVPVALTGLRTILPAGTWLPRRGTIRVAIAPPLFPSGTDAGVARALRDAVRSEILRRCGEPDLIQPLTASKGPTMPSARPWTTDTIACAEAGTLRGLFRLRVQRSPQMPAYRQFDPAAGGWRTYTWSEMEAQIARWRRALAREGLAPGERVAILLHNCVEWVCMDQAALALGLVVVPLLHHG